MPDLLSKEKIEQLILLEDEEFSLENLRRKHNIDPESSTFHTTISRLVEEKKIKRIGRGLYRKLKKVRRIKSMGNGIDKPIELFFPYGREDNSSFGFEDTVEIDEGDAIVIAGVSNSAKTGFVLNMLALNMEKYPCLLMGNEYAREDQQLSPKFRRRLRRMEWAGWEDGNGEFKFDILPVCEDYETWVEAGKINFIDWINLTEEFYKVGGIIEKAKHAVGDGILVAVLQKNEGVKLGRGGSPTIDLADFYIAIDPIGQYGKRLTVVKAKSPKKGYLDGKMWGFEIIEGGTQFHNIREIKRCSKCWGGYKKDSCNECSGTGYVDK